MKDKAYGLIKKNYSLLLLLPAYIMFQSIEIKRLVHHVALGKSVKAARMCWCCWPLKKMLSVESIAAKDVETHPSAIIVCFHLEPQANQTHYSYIKHKYIYICACNADVRCASSLSLSALSSHFEYCIYISYWVCTCALCAVPHTFPTVKTL